MQDKRPISFQQWLAQKIITNHRIDCIKVVELVRKPDSYDLVKLNISIKGKIKIMKEARKGKLGLIFWINGSKLDQGQTLALVCWEDKLNTK